MIFKQSTNMVPEPIEDHRQLDNIQGVSKSLAAKTFNKVVKAIVLEWKSEWKSFIVGACWGMGWLSRSPSMSSKKLLQF